MLEKISRSQQVEDLDHLEDLESFLGCHVFLQVFGSDWQVGFFQKWPYEVGTRCNALDRLGSEANLPPPKQRMIESVKAGYLMLLHFVQALIVLMTTWQTLSKICKKGIVTALTDGVG